jgi:hypothetical protein
VIFPYTPTISWENTVNYNPIQPVHANTDYNIYTNTPATKFTITGQFTAQTQEEARYMVAAMHFFRTVIKMRFGSNDKDPGKGLPPPVLLLSGYGDYMFNDLPIVINGFNMELPNTVNTVEVDVDGVPNWVPVLSTFVVNCIVQHSPKKQREFDWDKFANGELLKKGGWI